MADTPTPPPVGRLAPSPTGALHIGNIRTLMCAWLSARSKGGRVVLRIEDLDHPKVKRGSTEALLDDLRWLGFDWDEGPDVGGPSAPYVQSLRTDLYRDALSTLRASGLAYPCVCTRSEIERCQSAPHAGETLRYDGRCRDRFPSYGAAMAASGGRPPAWRFRIPDAASGHSQVVSFTDLFAGPFSQDVSAFSGDFAIARNSDGAGYALAVVVDDAAMGVTEVVRGDDLLPATPAQILIHQALRLPTPRYCHLPLVVGPDGRRLAKRHGDSRVSAFREAGVGPASIIGFLAASLGWLPSPSPASLRDLVPLFSLPSIPRAPLVFTPDLLLPHSSPGR
ncbi:MAG: tRNA glutamyl-Q(34) synthetase GluQRS [Kiritimatiellae bacterium]|nr:tRNA glutamyl-Q(34) synthetase GluQRS [Kiritimatiellia bacterium]